MLDNSGAVLSGSRDALIRRLVPTRDFCPDESYIFSLLVNIRTFISPHELMQKIVQVRFILFLILSLWNSTLCHHKKGNHSHLSAQIVFFLVLIHTTFTFLHLVPTETFSVLHVRSKCRLAQFRKRGKRKNVRPYIEIMQ